LTSQFGKDPPRVLVGNLGHDILKPSGIGVNNIVGELLLGLFEEFVLADKLFL